MSGEAVRGRSAVLIVGAGPAGCAAGLTLARNGVDVCVVDRARFPRDKTCGDALSNRAVELVRGLCGADRFAGCPQAEVGEAAVVFPDGHRVVRSYDPAGRIVPRRALDALLVDALRSSGARLLEGTAVRGLERDGAAFAGAAGPGFEWRADVVIAADGPGSIAGPALGRAYPRGRRLAIAATAYAEGVAFPDGAGVAGHYLDAELPCGYGWIFPAVEGRCNLGVYQRMDRYRAAGVPLRALLERFLARRADRLGAAPRLSRIKTAPLPLGPPRGPLAVPGLLSVGDAGGFVDPLTGEGIWQALRSGQLAAEVLLEARGAGGVRADERTAAEYVRRCGLEVSGHQRARGRAQELLRRFVAWRLYRIPPVRALLQWSYRRGRTDSSKAL